jgi:hypothetical protein
VKRALPLALGAALLGAGCVERSLLVESDPPGARLFVNGLPTGTTPARVRYVHDGRFDVRLEKEGHHSVHGEVTTRRAVDAVPGPDFVAENVWPGRIRRCTRAFFVLPPLKADSYTKEEVAALLRQAEDFRARAKASLAEPGTPLPTPPERRGRGLVDPFPGAGPSR